MGASALLFGGDTLVNVDSADFDGTNDFMTRGAGLSGAADSGSGIFAAWLRFDGGDGSFQEFLRSSTTSFAVERDTSNVLTLFARNPSGSTVLDLKTVNTYLAGSTWRHYLASWDLSVPGASHVYVNDVSDINVVTFTASGTIDYTVPNWGVGCFPPSSFKYNGCMAELYFAPGQYLDFSLVSNRRKFVSSALKPIYLGSDGSTPTVTAPLIYLHLDDGEAVADFATNRGTGGNFTITGTLDTGSTSPSD